MPVEVAPPFGFPVEGRPNSHLMRELRWYLEDFLDYPFPPETEHAERVLDALRRWGREAFNALFGSRDGGGMFDAATAKGYQELSLQIWSDDPRVLAWPWEALRDPKASVLAQACQVERHLNTVRDPVPLPEDLPTNRVNILLLTARPYEGDVGYRSISRPLVELIEKEGIPARVHVLRPPTFTRLREHLGERPRFYHIVHFDGHGAFGEGEHGAAPHHCFGARQGRLVFENDEGEPDEITAEQLSALLREHAVPAVVLNACQSAMLDERAEDPFASVAASLLQSGVRSVVAMAYSLYVSGAQEFLPPFYRTLFETQDVAVAARAGRQQMLAQPGRVCARGRFPLHDWLVPVLYQQEQFKLTFQAEVKPKPKEEAAAEKPDEEKLPHGFVGRDGELLKLERALRRGTPAILIQGLGGVGKTTLARGFVQWLQATEGIGGGCFWLAFNEIRSADYVLNRMGEALFGSQFAAVDMEQRIAALATALSENRFIIVWDNFEVVAGIPGTPVAATLSAEHREHLHRFLAKLRGGASKVIITSRSEEDWLGIERMKIPIGGLRGEERWEYCDRILRDLGIAIDRNDKDLVELMTLLDGHPLAMRVILPKLEKLAAREVIEALRSNLAALGLGGDEAQNKLYATLQFAEQSLEESLRPLLVPLALHERYVDGDYLADMTPQVDGAWTRERIDRFLGALVAAGLLRGLRGPIYEMHPALTGFLRSTPLPAASTEARDAWSRAFVDVMGSLADALAPRPLHEQRGGFAIHSANFYFALEEAEHLAMRIHQRALLQALAAHAQNMRNYDEARGLFSRLAEARKSQSDEEGEAAAYHQLGMIAQERRDFAAAEAWYRKSLAIEEKLGNEAGAASTYHQLGRVAEERRDFAAAETWYRKAMEIRERLGIEHLAATDYHQLGMIAAERRDFAAAEAWYRKAVAVFEKLRIEQHTAGTYHQLGRVAEERRDFDAAEAWYRKAVAVFEKLRIEHHAASTYGQLGILAGLQGRFEESGQWLMKSIQGFAKANDPRRATDEVSNFMVTYRRAPADVQAKLRAMWEGAGLGEFPEPHEPPEKGQA